MKLRILCLSLACCLHSCAPASIEPAERPIDSRKVVTLVGGKVIGIVDGMTLKVDGNFGPLGQDVERTVVLWGIKPVSPAKQRDEELIKFLRTYLIEDGPQAVACFEKTRLVDGRSLAECRIGELTIQEELLERKLVIEDYEVTDNKYGHC